MKNMINLLPPALLRQQMVRKRVQQWGVIIGIVIFAGGVMRQYEMREHKILSQRLELLSREHQPTQTKLKQLVAMREQLGDLHQQELVVGELDRQRHVLALLGAVSRTAAATEGKLRVTKLQLVNFQSTGQTPGVGTTDSQAGSVLVSGLSLDNPAVAELLDGLQDSKLFTRVELLSLTERAGEGVRMHEYAVRCEFQ